MTGRLMLTLGFAVAISSGAFAQTVRTWVSAFGSDANSCSRTSPCRQFAAAIAAVDPGGEVVVLDSAGYGPVVIDKSVSVVAPRAVHAAIAPTASQAISIQPGAGAVLLRNLFLNSRGATTGILHTGQGNLFVEQCQINGFSLSAIELTPSAPLYMSAIDCVIRNGDVGIRVEGGNASVLTVRGRLENLGDSGILCIGPSDCTVRDTVVNKSGAGFYVLGSGGVMNLTDSAAFACGTGFSVTGGGPGTLATMNLERCEASRNTTGLSAGAAGGFAVMRVSFSTITGNGTGWTGASIMSRSNNTLEFNGTFNFFGGFYSGK